MTRGNALSIVDSDDGESPDEVSHPYYARELRVFSSH